MPRMPVISPPVLKLMKRGNALAKSLAGETTLAAMLTASVATTDREHRDGDDHRRAELADELDRIPDRLAVDDRGGARDQHPHRRKQRHRRRQRDHLADDLLALAAPEAREVGHVERERRPEADHGRERRHEDRPELAERAGTCPAARSSGPMPLARETAHQRSTPVITSTNGAAQFSTSRSRSMPR